MIDNFSIKLAKWMNENGAETDTDIMRYSLNVLINTFSIIALSVIYGIISNSLIEILKVMISFAVLRAITGGVHIKSSELCIASSSFMIIILSILSNYINDYYTVIFGLISILFLLKFAPSRIEEQTNIDKKFYPLLKIISVVVVGLNFYFQSAPLAISFLVQSLTLINFKRR